MLSYQHAYHAGGPADVHKHALLLALLRHLARKDKPFTAVDLHAGEGLYALARPEAGKTGEFARGIGRLWDGPSDPALGDYRAAVAGVNVHGKLALYPGSPQIIRAALRPQDRLLAVELHPAAFAALRRWAADDTRIAVHRRDADEAIGGLLPPPIRRGLVLFDPSYEDKDDYARTGQQVAAAHRRWAEAVIAIWYPRLADARAEVLLQALRSVDAAILQCELDLPPQPLKDSARSGLQGTGLLILNPPWQFETDAAAIGQALGAALNPATTARTQWITPPR